MTIQEMQGLLFLWQHKAVIKDGLGILGIVAPEKM
jgi:arginyl-tRNA synthetase